MDKSATFREKCVSNSKLGWCDAPFRIHSVVIPDEILTANIFSSTMMTLDTRVMMRKQAGNAG